MTTTTISSTDLIGVQSLAYIRPITLKLEVKGARPNSLMHAFVDGQLVDDLCYTVGSQAGTPFYSDAYGQLVVMMAIPGGRFSTGNKNIIVSDTAVYANLSVIGSTYGSASTAFGSVGVEKYYQTTVTTTNVTENNVVQYLVDPLAQSFFTYGKKGGVFLTSLDLYFASKDASIPVRVEIRPMVNGYPSPLNETNPDFVVTKNPSDVSVSIDSSVATTFTFNSPVYLKEDSDYCFVVISNSPSYNLFTSKLGEKSLETNRVIFDQPFIGSLFKSENNVTWTAEQSEDIKFTLKIAKFNTTANASLEFDVIVPQLSTSGANFVTTAASSVITFNQAFQHGLYVGDKFSVSSDTLGLFNGISGTHLNGVFSVASVIDQYTITFDCSYAATSSGQILSGQYVKSVKVLNGGGGYSSVTPPVVSFVSASGSGASGVATVVNGSVTSVTVTVGGSGYLSNPVVSFNSSSGGSGAVAISITDAMFSVATNKFANNVKPEMVSYLYGDTAITGYVTTTSGNYVGGNLPSYSVAKQYTVLPNKTIGFDQNSLVASRFNEFAVMSNNPSMRFVCNMQTANENVSPMVDIRKLPTMYVYNNAIDNQDGETLTAAAPFGTIASVVVTSTGTGYTSVPTVSIIGGGGAGAVLTAVLTGTSVSSITITNPGSGFTSLPSITISGGGGSGASATALLTPFNTELSPSSGSALSRYLTTKIVLQTVSTGITLFANINSYAESNVDWYIRTSLSGSGVNHDSQNWAMLTCATERNLSVSVNEFIQYEFTKNGLTPFDTYDLKAVLRSTNPAKVPTINQYRVIIVA